MMSTIDEAQMDIMRARLGARRDRWAPLGVELLVRRSRGRGDNDRLFEHLFGLYLAGRFDMVDVSTEKEVKRWCELETLDPESVLMLLLGRTPHWTSDGIQQRHSRSLSDDETRGQAVLADTLSAGLRYLNQRKTTVGSVRTQPKPNSPGIGASTLLGPATTGPGAAAATGGDSRCGAARQRLIDAVRNRPPYMSHRLADLKTAGSHFDRPDFLWHSLLQSFSTMGNSRGYVGLIQNQANYSQITYEALDALGPESRYNRLETVLRRAGVRMPATKAAWLDENFRRIAALGGPEAAKRLALAQEGTEAKIQFVRQFSGIGPKYARNLWMDVYHPDFRESIAIDERIQKLSSAMGCGFSRYADHEGFYLDVAHEADLEGWELDRLLYNYLDYFLARV